MTDAALYLEAERLQRQALRAEGRPGERIDHAFRVLFDNCHDIGLVQAEVVRRMAAKLRSM